MDLLSFDQSYSAPICGIDEVGRGPLAGPVTACCVHIPAEALVQSPILLEMNDSKRITEKKRCILAKEIQRHCIWGLGEVTHKEIDEINILQATYKAMCIAAQNMLDKLEKTEISIEMALIDGNKIPPQLNFSQAEAIVKGDSKSLCIAAASILAKVTRDTYMQKLALEYPQYGWETNAGYGSKKHREAIEEFGPSPYHRMSFAPLKEYA